jgi:hypothetical protein
MLKRAIFKKRIGLYTGLVSIGLLTSMTSHASNEKSAPVSRFSGVDEVVYECTNATDFVPMPQMTRIFTLGGRKSDEVAVMFQAAFDLNAGSFATGSVQLLIDNVVQGPGNTVPIISSQGGSSGTSTHGFNWQSMTLRPGHHTAEVRWRTDPGSELCVDARSLIVLHNK